ncbi:WD40 repeat-like protein [Thozetella sp. PMI_491]|nr:WD40 repeat-like protein [Thozetella sp. PMI_491]
MANFGAYPPNMAPQDALVVRQETEADHAVVPYSGDVLMQAKFGPVNPFRDESVSRDTRKRVLTGHAEETYISEHTFRTKHRAIERAGAPAREHMSGAQLKQQAAQLRSTREGKGKATVAEGDDSYVGPWATYKRVEYEEVENEDELGSDEEYEVIEEEEDDEVVPSGTTVQAPAEAIAKRQQAEKQGDETTTFHGESEFDYQGRTYLHVPRDLDIDLDKEPGSITNYIPKKLTYTWKHHANAVTTLRLFPKSSHLGLSGSADSTIKIFDVYRQRELLRTFSGHSKAITDLDFNPDGRRFLSGSWDRFIKLWDTETGACIAKFTSGKTPNVIKFNPSEEHSSCFLAGMSDKKILQYDTRMGNEIVQEYDHHLDSVTTIIFCDENRRFMTTSNDRSLRVWDWSIPVPIKYIAEPNMFTLSRGAKHPNGKLVLYQSANEIVAYSAGPDKFKLNHKKSYRGHNNAGSPIDVAISPDGQFVASGDTAGFACFWDFKTCKLYHKIQASDSAINCVAFSEQETSKFFTAGAKGDIKFWD